MKKIFKRTLAIFLAVVMTLGAAPLSGIADIDFSKFIEVIPQAKASSDCTIGCTVTKDLFEGFERNSDGFTVLYKGQEYYVPCQVQYTYCVFSDVESDIVKYSIENADTYEVLYNSSTYLTWSLHKGSFSIHIPDVFQEGCYYYIDVRLPSIYCSHHECSEDNDYMYCVYVPYSYTLSYDANGGSGAPSAQTNCNKYTVPSTVPVRVGYNFLGWSANSNATYADYTAGDTVTLSADTTLYAVWESVGAISVGNTYTANIYESYGNEYFKFIPPSNGMYVFESSGSLDSKVAILDSVGNEIASDDDSGEGFNFRLETYLNAGTVYFVKIYAHAGNTGTTEFRVKNLEYTVTYDANGGSFAGNNQTKKHGESLRLSTVVPTKKGYDFLGWGIKGTGSIATGSDVISYEPVYQPGDIYTDNSDITLIAVWELHKYDLNFYITNYEGEVELLASYKRTSSDDLVDYFNSVLSHRDEINARAPEGKIFNGWVDENGNDASDLYFQTVRDTNLYATYNAKPIDVYVDYNHNSSLTLEETMIEYNSWGELLYGEDINEPNSSGKSYSDRVKSSSPLKYRPAEYMSIVSWKIYYVEDGNDPYDKANWKEGINADGTSTAKYTLIFHVEEWGQVCGENITWSFNEETGELSITGTGEITDNPWDYFAEDVLSVTVSEGITAVGGFYLPNVTEVSLPESLTTIYQEGFFGCISLKKITIPENVTTIGAGAFWACTALEEITIPENVTEINELTFAFCINLKEIVIPKNVETIGDSAFTGSGIKRFVVDKENKNFVNDEYGVLYNKDMTELIAYPVRNERTMYSIPDGVKTIKAFAFSGYSIEDSDLSEAEATYGNDNLKAIIIPDSVTTIESRAFLGCQKLEYVHIPSSVTSLGDKALLRKSTAYICSDTENCYAKTYADENGYTFKLCEGHEEHVHSYKKAVIKAASCTEDGEIKYTCDCLDSYTETVKKTGHKEGEWEIVSEATKQSEGRKIKKCTVCGATVKEETIPKLSDSEPATKPSTTKPSVEPTTKPAQPTTKPSVPATKPSQPTTKPSVPTTKPTEPTTKPITYTCPNCGEAFTNKDVFDMHKIICDLTNRTTIDIRTPSTSSISYGDSIILHADVEKVPEGGKIVWTADNANFTYTASADGTTCTVSPAANGTTTFTVTVVDERGNVISSDTQTMTAKAGFFQKLFAFFKKIFGLTKVIPEFLK